MKEWLTNLDLFTYNEFYVLKERSVNPRNKRIDLNQKHLGIWYAVLYFSGKIFASDTEYDLLNSI